MQHIIRTLTLKVYRDTKDEDLNEHSSDTQRCLWWKDGAESPVLVVLPSLWHTQVRFSAVEQVFVITWSGEIEPHPEVG